MIAAIYARKSTEQYGVADDQKSLQNALETLHVKAAEPIAGEPLFEFISGHDRFLRELRDHGEYSVEPQFHENEELSLQSTIRSGTPIGHGRPRDDHRVGRGRT